MKKQAIFLLTLVLTLFALPAAGVAAESYGKSSLTVLMYHKLSDDPAEAKNAFCVPPAVFEADIRFLKENGYSFCFASEVDAVLNGELPKAHYVAVTFDDGYESDYFCALPVIEKYGAKATFFIVTAKIGTEDHIKQEHLAALSASGAVEIGSHSHHLHDKTAKEIRSVFDSGDVKQIAGDFQENAIRLEAITGKKVKTMSYPNGIWTKEADKALRAAGFSATFTSDDKQTLTAGTPHGRINRCVDFELGELLAK